MNFLRTCACALACTLPLTALAQWQWVEKDGRKVFSDQPPPAHIPAESILKQPGRLAPAAKAPAPAASAPAPSAAATARPAASAPKISGKDKDLEDKKKQAEAAEAEKARAEKERQAKLRADNCARAKSAKADYDSGVRLARTNAKGEREIIDDAARAAEINRLQGILSTDCKPS